MAQLPLHSTLACLQLYVLQSNAYMVVEDHQPLRSRGGSCFGAISVWAVHTTSWLVNYTQQDVHTQRLSLAVGSKCCPKFAAIARRLHFDKGVLLSTMACLSGVRH